MFSTLFKWTKRIFWAGSIFLGLYYFGDFQVNGVNVRDWLRGVVPPAQMDAARSKAFEIAKTAYRKVDEKVDLGSQLKSLTGSDKVPGAELMDKISDKDQEKMMELLKSNLEAATDPQRQADEARRLEQNVNSIMGGGSGGGQAP